jgi:hypothetical protein
LIHQYTSTRSCNITVQKMVIFSHHNEHLKHNTIYKWLDNNSKLKNWKILHIEVPKCKNYFSYCVLNGLIWDYKCLYSS